MYFNPRLLKSYIFVENFIQFEFIDNWSFGVILIVIITLLVYRSYGQGDHLLKARIWKKDRIKKKQTKRHYSNNNNYFYCLPFHSLFMLEPVTKLFTWSNNPFTSGVNYAKVYLYSPLSMCIIWQKYTATFLRFIICCSCSRSCCGGGILATFRLDVLSTRTSKIFALQT